MVKERNGGDKGKGKGGEIGGERRDGKVATTVVYKSQCHNIEQYSHKNN